MVEVGYQKNEWCVVFTDNDGNRQLEYFDLFDEADEFICKARQSHVNVLGMMTTRFYQHYIETN